MQKRVEGWFRLPFCACVKVDDKSGMAFVFQVAV